MVSIDILLECGKLSLYALLLFLQGRVVGAVLGKRAAEHVVRLVYLALIHVLREIVVGGHHGGVVDI